MTCDRQIDLIGTVMLGLLPHCWADLAGISGGKNIYLGSGIIIIIIYPALSAAIRGRHLMDGSRAFCLFESVD